MARALRALLALAVLTLASPATAQETPAGARALSAPRAPSSPAFALDLTLDLVLPLVLAGRVALQVPGGVVIYVAGGGLPATLVDAVNDVGTGWGAWTASDAAMARELLAGATWLECGLGLRPAGTPGIELSVGYVLLWSHRTIEGGMLSTDAGLAGLDVAVQAVHAELGWQTTLGPFVLRIAAGWVHGAATNVSLVQADTSSGAGDLEPLEQALDEEVARRAFGPTLTMALGVRL